MKSILLILILLASAAAGFAQAPAAVERELLGYLDNMRKFGSYNSAYDEGKLEKNSDSLKKALLKYGKRADILAYSFAKFSDHAYVVTSRDKHLRIYSWDLESGGTMHNYDNVFQYKAKSGKIYTWSRTPSSEEDAGSFYHQLFQADTASGTIYLGVSTWIGSTSMAGQTISAYQINGEKLDTSPKVIKTRTGVTNSVGFGFDFFSVVDRPERPVRLFSYDESKKSFRFPVVIEDRKTPQGRVTNRFITYRFDGKYFVKVS